MEAKKGMFEIDPLVKVEMLKRHKMKQMLKKVKRDKMLQGIRGGTTGETAKKDRAENDTVKILEVLGHVHTAKKSPPIKLVAPQTAE